MKEGFPMFEEHARRAERILARLAELRGSL